MTFEVLPDLVGSRHSTLIVLTYLDALLRKVLLQVLGWAKGFMYDDALASAKLPKYRLNLLLFPSLFCCTRSYGFYHRFYSK